MKSILITCDQCGEEFRINGDTEQTVNYCPFCGSDIDHIDDEDESDDD